jgi:DNA-binding NtrC family response regulator
MNRSARGTPAPPVLVAEPDEDDRTFLVSALTSAGMEVVGTGSFRSAKAYLEAQAPPLLVAEMRLGTASGLDLALLGRHLRPEMSLVMTSRFHDPALQRRGEALGASFIQKPTTAEELFAAVFHATLHGVMADDSVRSIGPPLPQWKKEYREIVLARADVRERRSRTRCREIATFLLLESLRRLERSR